MFSNGLKWLSAIPRITKLLSSSKVDVRYSGDAAYTMADKNTGQIKLINLPTLSDPVSEDKLNLTFGYMFHELGHVYNTDFTFTKKNNLDMTSPLGMIFNIVEDTYVERDISGRFLEASKYLTKCRQFIIDTSMQNANSKQNKDEEIANMVVPYIRYYAGQAEFDGIVRKHKIKKLDFIAKFEKELKSIKSTQESFDVAQKIYKLLKQEMNFNNLNQNQDGGDSEQDKQNQGDQNSGCNSNQSDGDVTGSSSSSENDFGNALKKAIEDSDMFKNIRAQGTQDAVANGGNGGTPCGCSKIFKEENDNTYSVLSRDDDEFYEIPSTYSDAVKTKMLPDVNIAQMQAKLIRLFSAKNKKIFVTGKRKGKISGSNLYRLKLDDDRVFKQKIENKSLNTAITLLIDLSGSMSCGKDKCAMSAAYLFANILERVKIPYEVIGFSTAHMNNTTNAKKISNGYEYRDEAVKIGIFKSFSEKLNTTTIGRFCHFYSGVNHTNYYNCNDDGESILMALTRLEQRQEQRKMIFVLSDGMPNVGGCSGSEIKHLKDVVKKVESEKNYEIYGIGIQTEAVKKFYSNYSVLDKPEDLSKVIIEQLTKNIL